jgi:hypothetical protein
MGKVGVRRSDNSIKPITPPSSFWESKSNSNSSTPLIRRNPPKPEETKEDRIVK